jgi:hypothetical protein
MATRLRARRETDRRNFHLAIECIVCNLAVLILPGLDWPLAVPRSSGVMWAKGRHRVPVYGRISWRRSISWRVLRSASSSPWGGAITAYPPEHCASDILALRLARCGKDKARRIYENQSSYGICLNPAVASFREFPASRAEKFLGRHMERIVGRQGSHVDNDRLESGRKLRIPRCVHAGSKEQSDSEKSYLQKQ